MTTQGIALVLTKKQYLALKEGDTVLWRNKFLRTVVSAPKHPSGGIRFTIRRHSWTGRASTTYFYNDIKDKIKPHGKTKLAILKSEVEVLTYLGWNVRQELKKELEEHKALCQRTGRKLCRGFLRLKKLTKS